MNKFELSPSVVLMGIGSLVLLWLIGKLLGASFFVIAGIVTAFLILLIAYLVVRLYDEPLLRKIKHCFGISESKQEEEN
jgi:peptidoglycan/LPS O-acetylase OafA/YrhL